MTNFLIGWGVFQIIRPFGIYLCIAAVFQRWIFKSVFKQEHTAEMDRQDRMLLQEWRPSKFRTVPTSLAQVARQLGMPLLSNTNQLKFVWKNIFQTNFQFYQNCFQFIQGQMMLAMLNTKKRLVGNANFFGKLCIRKIAPFLAEELCQLLIQIALHTRKVAKSASRMREDCALQAINKAMK